MAKQLTKIQQYKNEWISLKERLPRYNEQSYGEFILVTNGIYIEEAVTQNCKDYEIVSRGSMPHREITHWMIVNLPGKSVKLSEWKKLFPE